jgi:hypothetical protein
MVCAKAQTRGHFTVWTRDRARRLPLPRIRHVIEQQEHSFLCFVAFVILEPPEEEPASRTVKQAINAITSVV